MLPRIIIPLPTSTDLPYNRLNWPAYAEAVSQAGGEPVECPLDLGEQALSYLAKTCHAVLLPGSPADVDPSLYGQPRDPTTAPPDHARERTDRFLLEHAYNLRKPLLGVCYGTQMLNVWRGGTLVQDLTIIPVNHSASRSVAIAHSVSVAPGGCFAESLSSQEAPIVEGFQRLPVNSSHHQAIGIPGEGLRVCARCSPDGVIEAIEGDLSNRGAGQPGHYVVGVQWHPERTVATSATSAALFNRLVAEAAAWLATRQERGN